MLADYGERYGLEVWAYSPRTSWIGGQIPQLTGIVRFGIGKPGDANSLSDFDGPEFVTAFYASRCDFGAGDPNRTMTSFTDKDLQLSDFAKSDRLLTAFLLYSGLFFAGSPGFVVHLGGRDVYVLREGPFFRRE